MFKATTRLLFACFLLPGACARAAEPPAPPAAFAKLVPTRFANGLALVEIRARCTDCPPWRMVSFYSNSAPNSAPGPVRQEQVSVQDGVTAMYAFPGTPYFANTKVERSVAGKYEQDRKVVLEALAHECARMKERVLDYVDGHPEVKEKLDRVAVKGRDYVEFETGRHKGIDYASCTQNALGLMGGTVGQLQIFVPREGTIVTAYLLAQKKAKFQTIEEFLRLRREFIEGYIDFLPE
jgi:hypothetical protein